MSDIITICRIPGLSGLICRPGPAPALLFPAVARIRYPLAVQALTPVLALVADAFPAVQIAFIICQIYTFKVIA